MNWTRGWWWLSRWVLVLRGDIIKNVLIGLLLGRLGETILGRVGSSAPLDHPHAKHARDVLWRHLADEEPEVSRQPSHVGANGDDPLPMPLHLVLNCKVDEIGKHRTLGHLAGGLIRLGEIEPCLDHHNSSLRSGDGTIALKGRWLGGLESNKPTGLALQQPSRCSGPQLKIGPEVFGTVLPGASGGTEEEGDEFPRLDPQKRMLSSSSLKHGKEIERQKMKLEAVHGRGKEAVWSCSS
ncbi:hypothetical protein GOBAR_AA34218 [Gossypium barbadense]|uniref:Uncharacterized protein n=1 Tax=Gossypium barbadense TaxID=3634 RepID=A0A2P5W5U5_GOSBA|nr:hypothetical protein GOBAR_AA34218 [Gossypium barbadense]